MRTESAVLLATVLAGCAPFTLHGPRPEPAREAIAAPVPRPKPIFSSELACIEHHDIDVWERRLRSNPDLRAATRDSLARANHYYLPRLRHIFRKAGLPPSLALLPVVESEFYRQAQGRLDDRGLWQLRVVTARRFGLVVNDRRDQRLHPYRASRAAARYLRALHRHYRNWPFTLAAYNAGENRVDRARAQRPKASFWQLADAGALPHSTREYVAHFLALVRVAEGTEMCRRTVDLGTPPAPRTPSAVSAGVTLHAPRAPERSPS
jgi:hypothetical protein